MLILKNKKIGLTILTIFVIAICSLTNVFLSVMLGNLITAVSKNSLELFYKYLIIGIVGFLFFMFMGIIMVRLKTYLIKHHNISIKKILIKDIIYNSSNKDYYSNELSLMLNDVKQLETKGIETEFSILSLFFTFIFSLIAAFSYDFWIAISFFIGSLIPVLFSMFKKKDIDNASKKWVEANSSYTNKLKDYFNGIETIKIYKREEEFINITTKEAEKMESKLKTMNSKVEVTNQILYVLVILFGLLIPFSIGVYRVIKYGVILASFISIVQLSNSLRNPAVQIMQLVNGYSTIKSIKEKYLIARKAKVNTKKNNKQLFFDVLVLKDLDFKYDVKMFENLNLTINANDKILIIGASGCGKSTLLKIIQKRLPIIKGTYLINGEIVDDEMNELFSLIRQQPLMFNETIRYNITLGEDYSESELNEAIKLAELTEIVLEKGANYIIGENGNRLSVGQLQRIEIARALIRKRPIILADEITSAQDKVNVDKIRKMLLKSPYTIIEVAHKITTEEKELYTQIWDVEKLKND